jgi:hypothetical protein
LENATCRFSLATALRFGLVTRYSIVTASRPISRAISSRRPESGVAMARANRSRHSSSLSAGKSGETIEGERLMRAAEITSGIESPLEQAPATVMLRCNWDDLASARVVDVGVPRLSAPPRQIGRFEVKNARQSAATARFLTLWNIRADISYFFYAS